MSPSGSTCYVCLRIVFSFVGCDYCINPVPCNHFYVDRNSVVVVLLTGLSCWHLDFVLAIVLRAILQADLGSFGCVLSLLAKVCVKATHFDCRSHFCLQLLVIRFNFLFTSALPKFFSASLVSSFLQFYRQQQTTVSQKKRHRLVQGCCYGNVLGIEMLYRSLSSIFDSRKGTLRSLAVIPLRLLT